MNSINLLLQNSPPWVEIEDKQYGSALIVVSPPSAGGGSVRSFRLTVKLSIQGGIAVTEQPANRHLPTFCLERHINPDGTFCLHLDSEDELTTADAAILWWSSLAIFLNNQIYAEKRGVWPLESGLSHGEAAREQLAMEKLAEPLGWKDDILRAMFRGKGWLAERLPRVSKNTERVLNARATCPRGCTWNHKLLRNKSCRILTCYSGCKKLHKPIARTNCPHRAVVEELVLREYRRQEIENNITSHLCQKGMRCCRTMNRCALRKDEGHHFSTKS